MNFNKQFLLICFFICLFGCARKKKIPPPTFNTQIIESKIGAKPAIFLSCTRCGCIVEELNKINFSDPESLLKFDIYADSNCIKDVGFKKILKYSPQSFLDSVYEENYSIILFKKGKNNIKMHLVKTEESKNMKQILDEFL